MPAERIGILAAAVVLDLILGDPHSLPHPVMGIGKVITGTERALRSAFGVREGCGRPESAARESLAGALLVLLVLAVSTAVPVLLIALAGRIGRVPQILLSIWLCYRMLALRSLRDESMKVCRALRTGDVEGARHAVSMIVGRDTDRLDAAGIAKAAIETVAENASDGVIAPLLYMIVFGVTGLWFYKAANTMDSMIGYRNDRYRYFGTAAARLDDVLNFLPARLSALAMIAGAPLGGGDAANAWRIWKRDRRKHASPNSAQTEAACAGALHIQLAGDAWYFGELHRKPTLGDPDRPVETEDIVAANHLMLAASGVILAAGMLVLLVISHV